MTHFVYPFMDVKLDFDPKSAMLVVGQGDTLKLE
jgi:hypothetical protein